MEHVAIPISFPHLQVPQTDMVSPHCRTLPNVISYSTTLSNLAVAPNGVTDDESGVSTVVAKTHWQRGIALCAGCKQERLHANEAPLEFGGGVNQKSHTIGQSVLQIWMKHVGEIHFWLVRWIFFGGNFPLLGPPPLTSNTRLVNQSRSSKTFPEISRCWLQGLKALLYNLLGTKLEIFESWEGQVAALC